MQPRHQSVARKGNAFGADIYKAEQQESKINEVSYEFPKPGATEPSPKTSFVTKVGDLGCGVGYYNALRNILWAHRTVTSHATMTA
jgi:hypothetical protein